MPPVASGQCQACGEGDAACGVPTQRDGDAHSSRSLQISHRLLDLLPALEAPSFEGQRLERLPPRLDQVQIRRSSELKDELPARIRQIEEEHIHGSMHGEIVQHGVNPLHVFGDPLLHVLRDPSIQLTSFRRV